MKVCDQCDHVHRNTSKNPNYWCCGIFPQAKVDGLTGAEKPSYHYCRDVLRLTPNDTLPCVLFKALPETGEPVVKESKGERSVTYRRKHAEDG